MDTIAQCQLKIVNAFDQQLVKQEGAELCQAQPAKHKLFGSNGAIFFWFELLMVVLLNC